MLKICLQKNQQKRKTPAKTQKSNFQKWVFANPDWRCFGHGNLLLLFSRLYMPCVSAQLETRQRIPRAQVGNCNKLFSRLFVELCLKLDLLTRHADLLEELKSDELMDRGHGYLRRSRRPSALAPSFPTRRFTQN